MTLPFPAERPNVSRLPPFGRRALAKIMEAVIWGERLSGAVCDILARSSTDSSLARRMTVQQNEEAHHQFFFSEFYRWLTGRAVPSDARSVSRSLRRFGEELLREARAGHTAEALLGLCVCLEGLATVLFEKSYPECIKQWPAGRESLERLLSDEERHQQVGSIFLDRYLTSIEPLGKTKLIDLAEHWGRLIQRSFRECAWKVFPFPVPVRALQKEFSAFYLSKIAEKGLLPTDCLGEPVVSDKNSDDVKESSPDAHRAELSRRDLDGIWKEQRTRALEESNSQGHVLHDPRFTVTPQLPEQRAPHK